MKRSYLKYIVAAAAAPFALASAPAFSQGLPVTDPGSAAQTIKVVQNGVQQVKKMQEQLKQFEGMAKTIGSNGPLAMATDLMKKAGMDFADAEKSPLAPYRAAMPGLLDALPSTQVGSSLGIANNLAQQAKTSINSGREFALKAFYKSGEATTEDVQNRQGVRDAAMRDSVTSGYAMAVFTKNDLGQTEGRMKVLADGVSASLDLRGDVQSNSAIALAQLQQLTVQNQLLSQLLEVQSTSAMAGATNSVR